MTDKNEDDNKEPGLSDEVKRLFERAHTRLEAARYIDESLEAFQKQIDGFSAAACDPTKGVLLIKKDASENNIAVARFESGDLNWTINIFLDADFIKITADREVLAPLRKTQESLRYRNVSVASYESKSGPHHEIVEHYDPATRQLLSTQLVSFLENYEAVSDAFFQRLKEEKEQDMLAALSQKGPRHSGALKRREP